MITLEATELALLVHQRQGSLSRCRSSKSLQKEVRELRVVVYVLACRIDAMAPLPPQQQHLPVPHVAASARGFDRGNAGAVTPAYSGVKRSRGGSSKKWKTRQLDKGSLKRTPDSAVVQEAARWYGRRAREAAR
jgi:hypothetical protein